MTKQGFLAELQARLSGLPQEEIGERMRFYSEMIDDRIEEGLAEDEAVADVGSVDEIASQILAEYPLMKIVKEKVKPKRSLKAWEIVLIILGFPLWLPLLIAAFAVLLSVYMVIWSLDISVWAVDLSFAASALGCVVFTVMFLIQGSAAVALASLGAGLFMAGCAILLFYGGIGVTKGIILLTKSILLGIKKLFIGKESVK